MIIDVLKYWVLAALFIIGGFAMAYAVCGIVPFITWLLGVK